MIPRKSLLLLLLAAAALSPLSLELRNAPAPRPAAAAPEVQAAIVAAPTAAPLSGAPARERAPAPIVAATGAQASAPAPPLFERLERDAAASRDRSVLRERWVHAKLDLAEVALIEWGDGAEGGGLRLAGRSNDPQLVEMVRQHILRRLQPDEEQGRQPRLRVIDLPPSSDPPDDADDG